MIRMPRVVISSETHGPKRCSRALTTPENVVPDRTRELAFSAFFEWEQPKNPRTEINRNRKLALVGGK